MSKRRCPTCGRTLKTAKQRAADCLRQKRFQAKKKALAKLMLDKLP